MQDFLQRFPFKFFAGILCKGVNLLLKSADIKSTKSIFSGAYAMEGIPKEKRMFLFKEREGDYNECKRGK